MNKPVIHKQKEIKDFGLGKSHDVKVNSNIVMPILAESIYKNPLSSMRELYNNEKTSAYKARKLGLKDQRIEIRINTETRDLTITGINTIGISKAVFNDIILNVGVSGNNSTDNIGMFGLGLYSYSILSENCVITTFSHEDKKHYSYIGKSALNFEEIETQDKLKEFGTRFYMNLKDNININSDYDSLVEKIKEIVKFSDIETWLFVDSEKIELIQYNDIFDYFDKAINHSWNSKKSIVYNVVQSDDYDIIYYKIADSNRYSYYGTREKQLLLLNTPIDFYHNNYEFEYIINIKNEQKYNPHISRDFFDDKIKDSIKNLINDNFTGFEGINKRHDSLKSWYEDPLKWFNWKFIDEAFRNYHLKCKNPNKPRQFRHVDLYTILPDKMPKELFYIASSWDKRLYESMKKENKLIVFINSVNIDEFKKIGFKEYKRKRADIIKKSKTTLKKKLTKNFKFHYNGSSEDIGKGIVVKTSNLNTDKSNLRYCNFNADISLIIDSADYPALTLDKIEKLLNGMIFTTSKGLKTFEWIIENLNSIRWINSKEYLINQKGLMLEKENMVLIDPQTLGFIILLFGRIFNVEWSLKTHYNYFKSIFKDYKLNILESIADKSDHEYNIDFYHNMKYLRDNYVN